MAAFTRRSFMENLQFSIKTKIALASINSKRQGLPYKYIKPNQMKCLQMSVQNDTIAVLPTGFGKTLIFQILQKLVGRTVIVACPLNSIIEEQLIKLQGSKKASDVSNLDMVDFIIDHPENLLKEEFFAMLRIHAKKVSHIVIDEAHIVQQWGIHFRKEYSKLQKLRAVLPEVKVLALTGSASTETIKYIESNLLMSSTKVLHASLNRENIKLNVNLRLSNLQIQESFQAVIKPIIAELKESNERNKFKKTVVYSDLKWCGFGYQECIRIEPKLASVVGQYHAPCTEKMRKEVMEGMREGKIQLLFATEAYSMGTDIPDIRRVVHFGVPKSIETYIQEVGRAGRDGQPAEAILYYNNSDIAPNRQHVDPAVGNFCRNDSCRWEFICRYFSCSINNAYQYIHNCCDNCAKKCTCSECTDIDMDTCMDMSRRDTNVQPEKAEMIFGTLMEYFKAENQETSKLHTGLTCKVANKIAQNYTLYNIEKLKIDFHCINETYVKNIALIISEIENL